MAMSSMNFEPAEGSPPDNLAQFKSRLERAAAKSDAKELESLCREILAEAESKGGLLAERESDLELLFEINNRIVSNLNLQSLVNVIVEVVTRHLNLERCSLFVHDIEESVYRLEAAEGMDPSLVGSVTVQPGDGIVGKVIQSGETLLLKDIEQDPEIGKKSDPTYSTHSLLSVPLVVGTEVIGVINVNNKLNGQVFTESDKQLLETLATSASIALVNARLYQRTLQHMMYVRNIVESIPLGILVLDRTGHITLCNRSTLSLVRVEDRHYEAKRLGEVFDPNVRAHLEEVLSRIWREGLIQNYEVVVEFDTAKDRALSLSGTVLRNHDQEIIGALILLQDLAQLHELEHLRHLDRMKTNFVATVSHELRTPLTSMIASISLLESKAMGDVNDAQMNLLAILSRNSKRLLNLINDLLDLSRMESGKVTLEMEEMDFNDIIDKCVESLGQLAAERKVDLVANPFKGDTIHADPTRVEQVVVNLVGNALKFTPEGGKVTVHSEERHGGLMVSVQDTGIGIPPDQVDKVFQKFHQGEDTMTRTFAGTGLGLAICKHIVEMHGGKIWCESESGKGSTFTFTIPAEDQRGEGAVSAGSDGDEE